MLCAEANTSRGPVGTYHSQFKAWTHIMMSLPSMIHWSTRVIRTSPHSQWFKKYGPPKMVWRIKRMFFVVRHLISHKHEQLCFLCSIWLLWSLCKSTLFKFMLPPLPSSYSPSFSLSPFLPLSHSSPPFPDHFPSPSLYLSIMRQTLPSNVLNTNNCTSPAKLH